MRSENMDGIRYGKNGGFNIIHFFSDRCNFHLIFSFLPDSAVIFFAVRFVMNHLDLLVYIRMISALSRLFQQVE